VVFSIPLAVSMWALLDAARRPEWAFSFANRSRTVWVVANGFGILFCGVGVVVAVYYLLKVRPQIAAIEGGRVD
jgi:hypothetical protein